MYFLGLPLMVCGVPPKTRSKAKSHQSRKGPYLGAPGIWAGCRTSVRKGHRVSAGTASADVSQLPGWLGAIPAAWAARHYLKAAEGPE